MLPWSFLQASRHVLFCFCPPAFLPPTNRPLLHAWSQMSMPSVFRCPVCRYCQTPEPVEENKCFECGVQEVNWHPACLVLTAEPSLLHFSQPHSTLFSPSLSLRRISGFVWSADTSDAAATSAGTPTSTLRKRSTHTLCSSPTIVCGTTQEVLCVCACVCVWEGVTVVPEFCSESFPRMYCSKTALTTFGHQRAACGSPAVWICSPISLIDTQ